MTRSTAVPTAEPTLHAALELSKNSWLLAIQFPDRDAPSLYPLRGGDAEGLMAKLDAARDRVAKITERRASPMTGKGPNRRKVRPCTALHTTVQPPSPTCLPGALTSGAGATAAITTAP